MSSTVPTLTEADGQYQYLPPHRRLLPGSVRENIARLMRPTNGRRHPAARSYHDMILPTAADAPWCCNVGGGSGWCVRQAAPAHRARACSFSGRRGWVSEPQRQSRLIGDAAYCRRWREMKRSGVTTIVARRLCDKMVVSERCGAGQRAR
jgi:hypothetical protein